MVGGRLESHGGSERRRGPGVLAGWRWDVALSFAGAQRDYVERVAQLCALPWLGFVPDEAAAAPAAAAARLAGIPVGELRGYGAREQTRTGHLQEIAQYLGTPVTEPRQTSVRS